jgi:hypothetical protein
MKLRQTQMYLLHKYAVNNKLYLSAQEGHHKALHKIERKVNYVIIIYFI